MFHENEQPLPQPQLTDEQFKKLDEGIKNRALVELTAANNHRLRVEETQQEYLKAMKEEFKNAKAFRFDDMESRKLSIALQLVSTVALIAIAIVALFLLD